MNADEMEKKEYVELTAAMRTKALGYAITEHPQATPMLLMRGASAIESLQSQLSESQAREKGCVWCKEDNKVYHDGQHFHMFCSYCGKRLEVKHELSDM